MLLSACNNTGTVNILIDNPSNNHRSNVRVAVAMSDVRNHLAIAEGDTLLLLNEANHSVSYTITTADSLVFTVPVIRARSQKNYTLNTGEKRLADNLLRFRTASIVVNPQ